MRLTDELIDSWKLKPGDILGFSGSGFTGGFINCVTGAFPGFGNSHIAIIASFARNLAIFESTTLLSDDEANACIVDGECVSGVQAHWLDHLARRKGKVWVYRLKHNLLPLQSARLTRYLLRQIGKPYDLESCLMAGGCGKIRNYLRQFLYGHDSTKMFCAELVLECVNLFLSEPVANTETWSPNGAMRYLVSDGFYFEKERLI